MAASMSTENGTSTIVEVQDATPSQQTTIELRLKKPKNEKKVAWTPETVDNENMNKKKSKCCCIYKKPREFDESSSDSEDEECGHCRGHVEKKAQKAAPPSDSQGVPPDQNGEN